MAHFSASVNSAGALSRPGPCSGQTPSRRSLLALLLERLCLLDELGLPSGSVGQTAAAATLGGGRSIHSVLAMFGQALSVSAGGCAVLNFASCKDGETTGNEALDMSSPHCMEHTHGYWAAVCRQHVCKWLPFCNCLPSHTHTKHTLSSCCCSIFALSLHVLQHPGVRCNTFCTLVLLSSACMPTHISTGHGGTMVPSTCSPHSRACWTASP